jgi:murein DD-endopeptidase MepM/ murein hydrolase activator NlpD
MVSGVRTRLRELAESRPAAVLSLLGLVTASAAAANPSGPEAGSMSVTTVVEKAVAVVAPPAPAPAPSFEKVWEGKDVDGDGVSDFANPTGREARGHDAYGAGEFGARRDGGSRRHEGVDFTARPGQPVGAPISGFVTRIGYAYPGDASLKFVEVTNPALKYAARVFYVNPTVQVGQAVAIGSTIGKARSLQRRYPGGMTDHVHLEIIHRGGRRIDAAKVITARYVPADGGVSMAAAD